ncbi:MAG: thioredoxin family protein [Akkermansia sp.]
MNSILIYGPGCAKCNEVLENTKRITAEMEGEFSIKKVTDPMQFAVAGVFMTPGLSLNGKLLFAGRNPSIDELKEMLEQALSPADAQEQAPPTSPCCCCHEKKPAENKSALKKTILFILLILLLLLAVKTINHNTKREDIQDVPTLR